jgi:NAD(P)H-nitrite reductase large subunit
MPKLKKTQKATGQIRSEELVCRCEEVSRETVEEAIRDGAITLDAVKRRTRAGMGLCQGRTCRRIVSSLITEIGAKPAQALSPPTARPPVRPIPMDALVKGEDLL